MSLAYAERWSTLPESPFIDEQNLRYFSRETAWQIQADQDGTTFSCSDPDDLRYFSSYRADVRGLVRKCPAAGEIFECGRNPDGALTFRVPTLDRANAFAAEKFAELPVAGIQAYQEKDMGATSSPGYLQDLSNDEFPKLPVAFGHTMHLHDLIAHWMGAATVDEKSFEVYQALCEDALSLWGKNQYPNLLYVNSLASGFDSFTGSQLRRAMDSYVGNEGYLLSQTLQTLSVMYRPLLSRAIGIVNNFGMDVEAASGSRSIIVPWEMENLPAYYDQVAERLRQKPMII